MLWTPKSTRKKNEYCKKRYRFRDFYKCQKIFSNYRGMEISSAWLNSLCQFYYNIFNFHVLIFGYIRNRCFQTVWEKKIQVTSLKLAPLPFCKKRPEETLFLLSSSRLGKIESKGFFYYLVCISGVGGRHSQFSNNFHAVLESREENLKKN